MFKRRQFFLCIFSQLVLRVFLNKAGEIFGSPLLLVQLFVGSAGIEKNLGLSFVVRVLLQQSLEPSDRSGIGIVVEIILSDKEFILGYNVPALLDLKINNVLVRVPGKHLLEFLKFGKSPC